MAIGSYIAGIGNETCGVDGLKLKPTPVVRVQQDWLAKQERQLASTNDLDSDSVSLDDIGIAVHMGGMGTVSGSPLSNAPTGPQQHTSVPDSSATSLAQSLRIRMRKDVARIELQAQTLNNNIESNKLTHEDITKTEEDIQLYGDLHRLAWEKGAFTDEELANPNCELYSYSEMVKELSDLLREVVEVNFQ